MSPGRAGRGTDARGGAGPTSALPIPAAPTGEVPTGAMSAGEVPTGAAAIFGPRLHLAVRYAELLATDGVVRGLIGPRETGRIWDRHLLNCAVIGELIETGLRVGDVGSGAGLPGIPLAIARPDLQVDLIEPLERRAVFLREVIDALGLTGVTVTRGRAEDVRRDSYDVVTARALAPLIRLVPLVLPLVRVGGTLLAMKGAGAAAELALGAAAIAAAGGARGDLIMLGGDVLDTPTVVVSVRRDRESAMARPARDRAARNQGSRGTRGGRRG